MKVIIYGFIVYILYQSIFKKNIEPVTASGKHRTKDDPKSNGSSHFVEYRFIYSIITLLLSI